MNIQRILCPIDFSEFNATANEYASVLAQSTGARIIYLHVSLPDVLYGSYAHLNMDEEEARDLKRMEEEFKPTVEGVEASYVVEFGQPSDQIIAFANQNDIDLIVMGTHGRTGLRRVVMGSIAEAIVRKAECPVLALKSGSQIPQPN